jgi:hypothetical protein
MDKIQTSLCFLASDAVARGKTVPSKFRTVVLLQLEEIIRSESAFTKYS